ncbi:MAG TPA: response regulator transcription factor [Egibacteraceae bacterium]|jgi:two-component system, NarL family, nitrate/nitrite response regulator NarL|nr:response regulator transcription factor [Egibacteraceae bacterium]
MAAQLTDAPIRVAVTGAVQVHLEGLERALTALADFEVVRQREGGAPAGTGATPDLVVVDAAGIDRARVVVLLRRLDAKTSLVALGVPPADCPHYRQAGFAACLGPEESIAQLVATVRRVARAGEGSRPRAAQRPEPAVRLTARELEVLGLVSEGLTNIDIARRLHIEVATVKNHVHHVLTKLGVRRRGEAAHWFRGAPGLGLDPPL